MKILLDENLPKKLKFNFGHEHKVFTVRDMSWEGKKNGEWLGLMTMNGFDAFVTIDKNLQHQQNLNKFPITLFVLNARNNKIETLKRFMPLLIEKINRRSTKQVIAIEE
jgi:hypothetical protein